MPLSCHSKNSRESPISGGILEHKYPGICFRIILGDIGVGGRVDRGRGSVLEEANVGEGVRYGLGGPSSVKYR